MCCRIARIRGPEAQRGLRQLNGRTDLPSRSVRPRAGSVKFCMRKGKIRCVTEVLLQGVQYNRAPTPGESMFWKIQLHWPQSTLALTQPLRSLDPICLLSHSPLARYWLSVVISVWKSKPVQLTPTRNYTSAGNVEASMQPGRSRYWIGRYCHFFRSETMQKAVYDHLQCGTVQLGRCCFRHPCSDCLLSQKASLSDFSQAYQS